MKIAIAGGITGGHLFPALTVAQALQARGHSVLYLGARHGIEARVPLPVPHTLLEMGGLRSTNRTPWAVLLTLWRASRAARRILDEFGAELLFTTGGYASIPIAMAFLKRGRGLVLLEPDALPGKANRWLARRAVRICINFEEAMATFGAERVVRTGLPLRPEVCQPSISQEDARAEFGLHHERFTVLVVGGSQGAQALNEAVLNTVQYLPSGELQWLHLTGEAHFETVCATAERLGLNGNYHSRPFLHAQQMGVAYRAADAVVGRGGAGSLTEFAINGLPMIVIPYPHAAGGHQRYNCQALAKRGAAVVIEQAELSPKTLSEPLLTLRDCPEQRVRMQQAARAWAIPDATERIVQLLEEVGTCTHPQASV
ncbi:MAG: UDP-N-acetylglucosamine--N-acetylmuramyl-(pentapeptide) pyrophosphoryl-undecaprenol N-acetylglucosamine transferase [Fimbriimonadales bacterium]|nr:MAG: UDP-N-acetylglucosamine--N-acetylmuramyl-(pentapeptide) pyrophosphoryl-undecaprenol N-acetylglucosamine transferase [Fimbriimonadales bacterium]